MKYFFATLFTQPTQLCDQSNMLCKTPEQLHSVSNTAQSTQLCISIYSTYKLTDLFYNAREFNQHAQLLSFKVNNKTVSEDELRQILENSSDEGFDCDVDDPDFVPTSNLLNLLTTENFEEEDNDHDQTSLDGDTSGSPTSNTSRLWTQAPFAARTLPIFHTCAPSVTIGTPISYLEKYFDSNHYKNAALYTNMYHLKATGSELKTTALEIKKLYGIMITMGTIKYPKIDLYWRPGYKLDKIASEMSKNRFRILRLALHFRDVSCLPTEVNLFWKIQPIIDAVKARCKNILRKVEHYSVDEQVIPFTGRCPARQFIRGKPRPLGIKNFVITTSKGLVMDFNIYEGKFGKFDKTIGLGAAVVLKLVETIPAGSFIYFDRFFTSIPLLKKLQDLNYLAIGTINNNRFKEVKFKQDARMVRGEAQEFKYDDGLNNISLVKWRDTKCVTIASTIAGISPMGKAKRWEKKERKFIEIDCPKAFGEYNKYMGGVDICDQLLEYYRIFLKTRKWTVKVAQHFIDLAVVNSWSEYRRDCEEFSQLYGKSMKPVQLLDFRLAIGESLLSVIEGNEALSTSESSDDEGSVPPPKVMKPMPLPNDTKRYDNFKHIPVCEDLKTARCCRLETCKGRTRCRCEKCGVFLCLTKDRNCFKAFHVKV